MFARNFRTLRLANGLSQQELAYEEGIDRTYISSLERRAYGAGIAVVDRLADVLGVETAQWLRLENWRRGRDSTPIFILDPVCRRFSQSTTQLVLTLVQWVVLRQSARLELI